MREQNRYFANSVQPIQTCQTGGYGARLRFPRKVWDEAVEKAGIKDIRFQDIRHHVVTQVANRHGIHIAEEVAHHKCIMTTQIYVNPTHEKVMQAFADIQVPEGVTMGS
ncbi:MAG TPA: hypothetical protein PLK80_11195 [bacterium]|nr:MAG: hypothetical protein BWY28_00155 [bacterium ADurb.Bin236]HOY63412.1 hypothetical protein [bacterium]HPI77287.1 hypothetical protein [bacterium]HPN93815.1 hypothetical protein [bacterium]